MAEEAGSAKPLIISLEYGSSEYRAGFKQGFFSSKFSKYSEFFENFNNLINYLNYPIFSIFLFLKETSEAICIPLCIIF